MKLRRPAVIISSALALTFGIGWLVDSIVAARVEMRIAQEIEAVTPVESNPRIYVGGFPYLLALSTHKVPAITSESLDVRIPGLGLVNLRTEADRVTLSNEQLLNGNIEGAKAKALSHYMRLDGVALGSFLNITDLDISHPSDISPTSTSASEAQLTGTPPNFTEPVVAEVKLRIKGSTISIEPTSVRGARQVGKKKHSTPSPGPWTPPNSPSAGAPPASTATEGPSTSPPKSPMSRSATRTLRRSYAKTKKKARVS